MTKSIFWHFTFFRFPNLYPLSDIPIREERAEMPGNSQSLRIALLSPIIKHCSLLYPLTSFLSLSLLQISVTSKCHTDSSLETIWTCGQKALKIILIIFPLHNIKTGLLPIALRLSLPNALPFLKRTFTRKMSQSCMGKEAFPISLKAFILIIILMCFWIFFIIYMMWIALFPHLFVCVWAFLLTCVYVVIGHLIKPLKCCGSLYNSRCRNLNYHSSGWALCVTDKVTATSRSSGDLAPGCLRINCKFQSDKGYSNELEADNPRDCMQVSSAPSGSHSNYTEPDL